MLRLALIGCPDDVARYPALASRIRDGRFTAVVVDEAVFAQKTAQALGADLWADNFSTLLAEHPSGFDAVVVAGLDQSQLPVCKQAAAAGKHLLVDWPLALAPSHTRDVINSCESASVRLMFAQESRFLPSVQAIKASLDSGKLGEPGLLRIHRWEARAAEAAPARPLTREIDLACWLFGGWPSAVFAAVRSPSTDFEYPDYVQLHLGFPGGGMALIDHAQTLPEGDGYFSLSLIGSTGAAYADDHHDRQLLFGGGRPAALLTPESGGCIRAVVQEFIRAVQEKREPLATGADFQRASEVAGAADSSIARGQSLSRNTDGYVLVG